MLKTDSARPDFDGFDKTAMTCCSVKNSGVVLLSGLLVRFPSLWSLDRKKRGIAQSMKWREKKEDREVRQENSMEKVDPGLCMRWS